ncbi:MAG: ArgE/DapE family deacylase [Acidobacteriota bacterium]|nr:ArgE/DapE family deacylase [Acidobacteriota bacterium]
MAAQETKSESAGAPALRMRLARRIAGERASMAELIERLIRIPTENPPGVRYHDCAALLASALEALGFASRTIEIPAPDPSSEKRYAVVAEYGTGARVVCFHGHYDVVPASVEGQFEPRWQGDALFGRGSSDMKSGLVAMLYAVKALRDEGTLLDGRIRLLFVPDEETGGVRGSGHLAADGWLARDVIAMFLPEPTSGVVWHANRGAITMQVTVKGRPAHVSLQHQGVNAFEQAIRVVERLQRLRAEVAQRRTALALKPDEARPSILLIGGQVAAGTNFNVVPAECRFTIDRRINPEEDLDEERRRLDELFDAARRDGIDVTAELLQEGRSSLTPADTPAAQALAAAVEQVTGRTAAFELCPGLLEIRFYAAQGVPAFAYGPGILAVSHGPKEFVRMDRVVECAAIYALMAASLLAPEPALPR